jgi:hypothetical protein
MAQRRDARPRESADRAGKVVYFGATDTPTNSPAAAKWTGSDGKKNYVNLIDFESPELRARLQRSVLPLAESALLGPRERPRAVASTERDVAAADAHFSSILEG